MKISFIIPRIAFIMLFTVLFSGLSQAQKSTDKEREIAEIEKVYPQVIKTTNKLVPAGKNSFKSVTVKTVDYNALIPLLLTAIQEQRKDIDNLKGQLQKLTSI